MHARHAISDILSPIACATRLGRGFCVLRIVKRHWLGAAGAVVLVLIVLAALLAPALAPYDPNDQLDDGISADGSPLPPSDAHLLGTDLLGRDLLSRLLYGARTSLVIGVVANGIAITIGAGLGVIAGYT